MAYFKYEVRHSDGDSDTVYDAIFSAPDMGTAEDHLTDSIRKACEEVRDASPDNCRITLNDRLIAIEIWDDYINWETEKPLHLSWTWAEPSTFDTRPDQTDCHKHWPIGDLKAY